MTGQISINMAQLATHITEIRDLAETVRTYGTCGKSAIAYTTPASLHVIAAQLESQMRSFAQTEATVARLFDERQGGQPPIRFPELRAVLSYVTPSPVSNDVQLAELRAAATYLRTVARGLATAMVARSTPSYIALLETEAKTIEDFANALG